MEMQGAAAPMGPLRGPGSKGSEGSEGGGIAIGHTSGVRVNGSLSRRFLRFLGLTATTWLRVVVSPTAMRFICRLAAARKTEQPRLRRAGNAPLSRYAGLPPEGEVLATLCLDVLMKTKLSGEEISPSGGDVAAGDRRGAFPTGAARLYGFPFREAEL